ncbi:MAG TPA: hypothetical protein VF276_10145 [Chloroflexia bacterium]
MTTLLITLAAILVVAALDAWGRTRKPAPPAAPVHRDYLAPDRPLYGAQRLPTRPVRPYTADEEAIIATVWGDGTRVLARPASTPERN